MYYYFLVFIFSFQFHLIYSQSAKQVGLGVPCSNRIWKSKGYSITVKNAAISTNSKPMPAWNDTAYLDWVNFRLRTGDAMMAARFEPLKELVMVECVDYNGEFLPKIEEYLNGLATQRSWAFSAHDTDLSYYNGRYFVELCSGFKFLIFLLISNLIILVAIASNIAQTYYMFEEKLSQATKTNVLNALNERIFQPMRLSFANDTWIKTKHFWEDKDNNWNAVCWSGVVLSGKIIDLFQK
jgi:hypothetical protein